MSQFQIQGVRELEITLGAMAGALPSQIDKAARQTALAIQRHAVKSIQRGKPRGITYKKYKPKRTHTASAPGQAPASDTGRLAGSILPPRQISRGYSVGTNLDYGRYLEFGTRRIAERPWLRPAVDAERPKFLMRVQKILSGGKL